MGYFWDGVCGFVVAVVLVFLLVMVLVFPFVYNTSKYECRLYNQKFNTSYTVWEFFWAGSTIKEFLNQGKQSTQHIEIKGAIPVTEK